MRFRTGAVNTLSMSRDGPLCDAMSDFDGTYAVRLIDDVLRFRQIGGPPGNQLGGGIAGGLFSVQDEKRPLMEGNRPQEIAV